MITGRRTFAANSWPNSARASSRSSANGDSGCCAKDCHAACNIAGSSGSSSNPTASGSAIHCRAKREQPRGLLSSHGESTSDAELVNETQRSCRYGHAGDAANYCRGSVGSFGRGSNRTLTFVTPEFREDGTYGRWARQPDEHNGVSIPLDVERQRLGCKWPADNENKPTRIGGSTPPLEFEGRPEGPPVSNLREVSI